MKKITSFIFTSVAVFASINLSSCKKDKDNNATLTGTWDGISIQIKTSKDGALIKDTTTNLASGSVLFTLHEDKTFELQEVGEPEPETGYYATTGNQLIMSYGDTDIDTVIYAISGNNLQLNSKWDNEDKGVIYHEEQITRMVKK